MTKLNALSRVSRSLAAAWFAIALALGCGLTTPQLDTGDGEPSTATPGTLDTPTPTLDPTQIKEIDDRVGTAIYGQPTPTPGENRGDQAFPTVEAPREEPLPATTLSTPTRLPPPFPAPTPNPFPGVTIDADFCFNVNLQNPAYKRLSNGMSAHSYIYVECIDLVGRTIGERCPAGPQEPFDEELQSCVKEQAEMIKDYTIRASQAPQCLGIGLNTDEQLLPCYQAAHNEVFRLRTEVPKVRMAIREVIDRNEMVITAEADAWACLEKTGQKELRSEHIDNDRLLFWQNWVTEADSRRLTQLDGSQLESLNERLILIDQCAVDAGVYQARYDALMAELRRLAAAEPEKIEPLIKFGTLAALEEYGPEMLRP